MTVKLLTEHHLAFLSLKGGCTGSSETTLVKMPHCWKSRHSSNVKGYYVHKFSKILVCFDALRPIQQYVSHAGTFSCLPVRQKTFCNIATFMMGVQI